MITPDDNSDEKLVENLDEKSMENPRITTTMTTPDINPKDSTNDNIK
jgi:hypothetical protein